MKYLRKTGEKPKNIIFFGKTFNLMANDLMCLLFLVILIYKATVLKSLSL